MSVTTIDLAALRRSIAAGAQLVEVLPAEEYEELHLPGDVNIPLKRLDAESTQQLDRGSFATGWSAQTSAPWC